MFQGCAEIMSGLHFVRTGIPDTPKTPLSASSFHEYYSDTPRHHPDIPKTTPRHLQGTQDVNRRQHAVCMGYLRGIHGNWRHSDVFEGYLGFQSLQYGALTLFRHSPETHNFFCLTKLRHQNIKMSIYKADKNHWVM